METQDTWGFPVAITQSDNGSELEYGRYFEQ